MLRYIFPVVSNMVLNIDIFTEVRHSSTLTTPAHAVFVMPLAPFFEHLLRS